MKIVLIEDQTLLSSTLIQALAQCPDLSVVGQSDKATDALPLCQKTSPDLVVMDVFTKEGNGIECTAELKRLFPEIKVLIMSGVEDDNLVRAADQAGADVFVWKNVSLADFIAFIRQAGKSYRIFPSVRVDADKPAKFSEADKRILQMLAEGKSTREIAAALYLGYGTVRLYISHMYTATGFNSRAQLVAYALRCGLIDPTQS